MRCLSRGIRQPDLGIGRSFSIVCVLLSTTGVAQTQAPPLGLVTLPMPAGGSSIVLEDIDAAGNILGHVKIGSRYEVVEWLGGTTAVVFPRLAADQSIANRDYFGIALNAAGAVVGQSNVAGSGTLQGIYWDASRHPTAIAQASAVSGLSDTGVIAGAVGPNGTGTAAQWANRSSQPALLPYPMAIDCANPAANQCYSRSGPISPNGRYIYGYANLLDLHSAYSPIWAAGVVAGNFGSYNTNASQITNSEIVIGSKDTGVQSQTTPFDVYQAYRWESGTFVELGALPGAPAGTAFESNAAAMNSNGVIVGSSQAVGTPFNHAVMWIHDQIIDLHAALASQLPANTIATGAFAINDSGEFIVSAENVDTGTTSYYVAKPLVATHTTITSNINPSTYGQQIHLVAKVSPDSGPVPTTGSVSWYDNGTLAGSARMTTIGTASWEPSAWTGGVHNVTATFPGSTSVAASTSPVFKQTVNASATRTTISASASPATHGQLVTLTATVVPTSGTIAGTVTFRSGSTVLGTGTLDSRTKQTRFTTSFAKAGGYSITASFSGSQNFVASASTALALTVK
jgi:hypothetical protein